MKFNFNQHGSLAKLLMSFLICAWPAFQAIFFLNNNDSSSLECSSNFHIHYLIWSFQGPYEEENVVKKGKPRVPAACWLFPGPMQSPTASVPGQCRCGIFLIQGPSSPRNLPEHSGPKALLFLVTLAHSGGPLDGLAWITGELLCSCLSLWKRWMQHTWVSPQSLAWAWTIVRTGWWLTPPLGMWQRAWTQLACLECEEPGGSCCLPRGETTPETRTSNFINIFH